MEHTYHRFHCVSMRVGVGLLTWRWCWYWEGPSLTLDQDRKQELVVQVDIVFTQQKLGIGVKLVFGDLK